jgi:hypothetical protein
MIRKKIEALKNKNYRIKKIVATTIFSDDNYIPGLGIPSQHTYFSKSIYEEGIGYSNTYIPYIAEKNKDYVISEIATKVNIEFSIDLREINDIKPPYKLKNVLEIIANDVIKALNIKRDILRYNTYDYYSEAVIYLSANSTDNKIIVTIYLGTANFEAMIEKYKNLLVEGAIHILKTKSVSTYF